MTITDPMTDPQVVSILANLRSISSEVESIDSELGTDGGTDIAKRNKVASDSVAKFNTQQLQEVTNPDGTVSKVDQNPFNKFIAQVVNALSIDKVTGVAAKFGADVNVAEFQAAIYHELGTQLSKTYGDTVKKYLQGIVDAQPKVEAVAISEDKKKELTDRRSNIANIFKLQAEMLKYYNVTELPSDITPPPVRRGSSGPRVKMSKEFQYFVDGKLKQLTDQDTGEKSNVNLSYLANTVCKDLNWKTPELRDFIMKATGTSVVDGELNLPDSWEVTLPAPVNKVLKGVAVTTATPSVNEEEDGETDTPAQETAEGEDAFASA